MEAERKKLSSTAYGGCKGEDYIPFVPTSDVMPETTGYSIIVGVIIACIFAAANAYLGLKVGITIASAIPGAILAVGILKGTFKRNNILEANLACSLSGMGEAAAGCAVFVLPSLILAGFNISLLTIILIIVVGGSMGVFFITPLRRYLIVEEHGNLVYPEGMAAAEVLVTASQGGSSFKTVLVGIGLGGVYNLLSDGFKLWGGKTTYTFKGYQGTMVGFDTLAPVLGVGFIVGVRVGLLMFGGSLVAWFGLIPLIKFFGAGLSGAIFPSTKVISQMTAMEVWSNYIKYIGAGAVAMGGFISLAKSLPTIINSFKQAITGLVKDEEKGNGAAKVRTNKETPIVWLIGAALVGFFATWLLPMFKAGILGGILAVLFAFFFAVVSARMVGIIGESNNPVSGMAIASLLFIAIIFRITGLSGSIGVEKSLIVTSIVAAAVGVAGATSQGLKTTFIIGGTPKDNHIWMWVAMVFSAVMVAVVIFMLNKAYGLGSLDVPAPQATLMKMLADGIITGQIPWTLVFVGVFISLFCEMAGIPILPVALGVYLPITLNATILAGGVIRVLVEKRFKKDEDKDAKGEAVEKGILTASGLVAGGAIMGIIVAMLTTFGLNIGFGENILPAVTQSNWLPLIMFLLLALWFYNSSVKGGKDFKIKHEKESVK
ncbi:OPT family oligopeptide transporter [Clostridium sp.]|uniref:OPT family oligopeptide transporter n=1 Tax=Clostridium sp. TaxID=1506 RepID=UPI002FCCAC62